MFITSIIFISLSFILFIAPIIPNALNTNDMVTIFAVVINIIGEVIYPYVYLYASQYVCIFVYIYQR